MPFNGSGAFAPPGASFPVVSGAVIDSAKHNAVINDIASGLSTCVTKDGQTTITADQPMAGYKHTGVANGASRTDYAAVGQVQDSAATWAGTAGGTANAITLTLTPAISAYAAGQSFTYKSGAAANTAAMTVNVSSVGTKAIQKNGAALASGDHPANMWFRITYDGAAFQLQQIAQPSGYMLTVLDDVDAATARTTLGAVGLTGNETVAGIKTLSGANVHSGANTFSGNNTHSGVSTFTGNLVMSGKPVIYDRVNISAPTATTTNIWTANSAHIAGSATVFTDFADAPQAGAICDIYCETAHTFTNNANLLVDGGITYVSTIGDRIRVRAITTTYFSLEIVRLVTHPGIAKAWVCFNGTGVLSVLSSYNVSSVTDNGTGDYTVNFTTPFANANYAVSGFAEDDNASGGAVVSRWAADARTSSSIRIRVSESTAGAAFDSALVSLTFHGYQ